MARAKTRLKIPGFCPIIFEEQSGGVTVREKMCAKNVGKRYRLGKLESSILQKGIQDFLE